MNTTHPELSVVVPVYNEHAGIETFHQALSTELKKLKLSYEVIYVNDGSSDDSLRYLKTIAKNDESIRFLSFSRNFGKELAVTAGVHVAHGKAILMLDADGQHPVQYLPEFVRRWQAGAKVVVGVRTSNHHRSMAKGLGSRLFYKVMSTLSGVKIVTGSTDFRLIDHAVQRDFMRLTERNRITRGLIDWLGYPQEFVKFDADGRIAGDATYSYAQLTKLFIDSIVSMSTSPLYLVAYIGAIVLPVSGLLLVGMLVNALAGDPLNVQATGGAYLIVVTLCLVGILMVSQGIIGLYLSHIHAEAQNRPLYVIDESNSSQKT